MLKGMKIRTGFTVVEVIIIIAVIGILTGLTVVNLRQSMPDSRDHERKADVSNIATHLDNLWTNGYPGGVVPQGSYPSTAHLNSSASISEIFADIDSKILTSPTADSGTVSLVMATNNVTTTTGVTPAPTTETYIYQPLTSTGLLCTSTLDECRRYNLFYKLEDDTIQRIMSKNQ